MAIKGLIQAIAFLALLSLVQGQQNGEINSS